VLTIINACREGQYLNQKVQEQFDTFANGITTLRHLDQCLKNLITTHDIFQEHNDELRPVIILIDHDIRALKDAWVTIATLMEYLCANKSVTWANRMNANGASVVAVLNQSNPNQTEIRRAFHRYYRYSSQGFNRVDKDLLDLCNELRLIGEPLKEVLKVFT
jgi:hypothetical protein